MFQSGAFKTLNTPWTPELLNSARTVSLYLFMYPGALHKGCDVKMEKTLSKGKKKTTF